MEGNELVAVNEQASLSPSEVVKGATIQAKLLMDIVEQTQCFQQIRDKKYLQVEAWETIGAFNRTHVETESITPILKDNATIGYQAHVQLFKDGMIVGGAIMPCYFTENCCKGKEGDAKHKACMSAAQTFATSKAYRMNYSYVAILAGYQPLPAEEITEDMKQEAVVDKTEHYCKLHGTQFFMKGKMKSHAHPIKDENGNDTGEWCHEHKEQPKPAKEAKKSEPEELFPETEPTPEPEREPEPPQEEAKTEIPPETGTMPRPDRDPESIRSLVDLFKVCHADFGLQPAQVVKELGYTSKSDITDLPSICYERIVALRCD